MRREHIKEKTEQSYIDWLKSLGCVFYAPLNQENAYKDLITGIDGTVVNASGVSVGWDSTKQAYKFHAPDGYCAMIWANINGLTDQQTSPPPKFSLVYTEMIQSARYWDEGFALGGVPSTGGYYYREDGISCSAYYGLRPSYYSGTNVITNVWRNAALVMHDNGHSDVYINGTYIGAGQDWYNTSSMGLKNITMLCANSYWYTKNAMLFNTDLDLTTIRKIQGYE